jgi:hypothetical protein
MNAYIMYPSMGDGRTHNFVAKDACSLSDGAVNCNLFGFVSGGGEPSESN